MLQSKTAPTSLLRTESNIFPFHKAWALFLLFYAAVYLALATAFIALAGPVATGSVVAIIALAQALRFIGSEQAKSWVLHFNRTLVLWLFRASFLALILICIGLALAPFMAVVWTASAVGGATFGIVAALLGGATIAWVAFRSDQTRGTVVEHERYMDSKSVAIIGGGVAGVVSAKECLQEGLEVTVLEKSSRWGGVWNADDSRSKRTTGRTMSSSSRYNSFFSDFPMRHGDTDTMYPTHYSEQEYRDYLADYIKQFELDRCVEFDTEVVSTEQSADGAWTVTTTSRDGDLTKRRYDHVIVCTGLNHQRNSLDDTEKHAGAYRGNDAYKGQKVVIVGMGESSSDLAAEIADVADEVHVIVRSPVLLLPRNTFGQRIAPDHKLSRLILGCPQFIRTTKLLSQTVAHGLIHRYVSKVLGLKNEFGTTVSADTPYEDNWSWEWFKLFYKLGFAHPKAGWGLTRNQVTKTAPVVRAYQAGRLHFHTVDIKSNDGSTVLLSDGTRLQGVDSILDATGYKPSWPFLPNGLGNHDSRNRYRLVFNPDLPGMSFIGFARGGVGSVFQAMEMQARWTALVFSGARRLPTAEEMRELIPHHRKQMVGKWPTKVSMVYGNALARHEIGCEPDLWNIFKRSPKVWFYLMAGPYCLSMYRFHGPHARPDIAYKVYDEGPDLVLPLEYPLQQFLELTLGTLARFWTSIPPLNNLRKRNEKVRTYVTPFIDLEY